jgi:ATP-dependent helicase HepA
MAWWQKIEAQDQHAALENYMMEVFDAFNIETEDLAPRTYLVLPYLGNALAFPGLEEEGSTVTFDRKRALSREDIGFLSWDHPLVTGAIDIVLGTGLGAASYAIRKGRGGPDILLEVLFVLETIGPNSKAADRFLPNTPLRVVVDHTGKDLSADFPFDELDMKLHPGQIDDILDDETLMETILPIMLEAATRIAEHNAQAKIATALYRMNSTHDHEIQRLQTLQTKNNHIRPQEIQTAIDEQQRLKSLLLDAKIRLDAVQLILGEGY